MKRYILPLTLLVALMASVWLLRPAQAAPALTPKWEHKMVERGELIKEGKKQLDSEKDDKLLVAALNVLGDEGWQLAGIEYYVGNGPGAYWTTYVFRRPK
jgi:hypothetical protein